MHILVLILLGIGIYLGLAACWSLAWMMLVPIWRVHYSASLGWTLLPWLPFILLWPVSDKQPPAPPPCCMDCGTEMPPDADILCKSCNERWENMKGVADIRTDHEKTLMAADNVSCRCSDVAYHIVGCPRHGGP